ncbi:hypothetical protein M0Q50_05805 [bacterium]|jgi:hypothetical protein|nr:hypothetical protein [bacterium]
MENQTLLARVEQESINYRSAEEAAIDHLNLAHSHLFEEFEGRDVYGILTAIDSLLKKVEKYANR